MITKFVKIELQPLEKIERLVVDGVRNPASTSPIRVCFKRWSQRYRSFSRLRYVRLSRGGGEWPDLKEGTKLARAKRGVDRALKKLAGVEVTHKTKHTIRKGQIKQSAIVETKEFKSATRSVERARVKYRKEAATIRAGGGSYAILRDTGTMFNVLAPTFAGAPGAVEEHAETGVYVGYGGPARHPGPKGGEASGSATIADLAFFHDTGKGHLPARPIIVSPDDETLAKMGDDLAKAIGQCIAEGTGM